MSAAVPRILVGIVLAAALLVASALAASRAYGTAFPSLFVDPFGGFSAVTLPAWGDGLDVEIGAPVTPSEDGADASSLPAERLSAAAAAAEARGDTSLRVVIGAPPAARQVSLPLRRLGAAEILWLYGLYVLAGLLLLWSGMMVGVVAGEQAGGRAYVALALVAFVFLVTFLDYHTTRWLAPLFAAATVGNSVALFGLAWHFPEAPAVGPTARRIAALALWIGVAFSIALALCVALGIDFRAGRRLADLLAPCALFAPIVGVLLRMYRRDAQGARKQVRSAALALLAVPITLAVAFAVLLSLGRLAVFPAALPFVSFAVPGAIGTALIRHNALGVRRVVTQRLLYPPIGLIACTLAAAFAQPLWAPGTWVQSIAVGASVGVAFSLLAVTFVARVFGRATATFQPTLEGLADEVAALRRPDAIRGRLAELVHRCLPSRDVRSVSASELDSLRLTEIDRRRLAAGQTVWTDPAQSAPEPSLVAPLRFGGQALGALIVSPRAGDGLFTDAEIRMFQTMVSLGALALHHAELLREVEERRAIEVAATRGDGRRAVDAIAAEIAHELSYPITFFRHTLNQVAAGRLSHDIVEVGKDEVERLERMLAWVRKLQVPVPEVGRVRVRLVVGHALVLLQSELEARHITCDVDVPAELEVAAEQDALLQLVANLLRNAIRAARSRVGVAIRDERGLPELAVWDDGPGVPADLVERIFDPSFTTQSDVEGHGLGLAVAQRVVTGFGWSIDVRREDQRTVFAVSMRQRGARADVLKRVAS